MRYKEVQTASTLGIIGNLFLSIIKGIIGFMTRSNAMIADSLNSAGDIVSSLMTYIGNKIASKPSDEEHNLGYGKAEYVFSMLVSIVIILTAAYVIKDSISSILYKSDFAYSPYLIVVCLITIIVKFALYLYTNKLSKKYHNLLIEANSKDHLNDILITSINLVSCILVYNNIYIFDGIAGIIIGLFISIGLLIALSMFFSMCETAFVSVPEEKFFKKADRFGHFCPLDSRGTKRYKGARKWRQKNKPTSRYTIRLPMS